MLDKIMNKGDEYVPDYNNWIGKTLKMPPNPDKLIARRLEMPTADGYPIQVSTIWFYDYKNVKVQSVLNFNGEPFMGFYYADNDVKSYSYISIPWFLKNGGVLHKLKNAIQQWLGGDAYVI